jgi:hypothetical protein
MTDYEIPINNSAGRLVCLLKKAIVTGQKNIQQQYISAVCEALELPINPVNHSESLSNLFYLIHQIEKDLALLTPTKIKNHKRTITELKNIIASGFMGQYQAIAYLNNSDSHIIRDLENCADSLSELVELEVIEEEELTKIINDIDGLYQIINTSNINKDLKFLLLKKLSSLKEVIENYQFQGSDGIKREVENFIGSMTLNKEKVTNKEEANFVKKTFDLFCKVLSAASAAKNLLPENITEIVQNLLPPG